MIVILLMAPPLIRLPITPHSLSLGQAHMMPIMRPIHLVHHIIHRSVLFLPCVVVVVVVVVVFQFV